MLLLAYIFRFANWVVSLPHADWHELTKVDILNCMGVGLMVFTVAAVFNPRDRARVAARRGAGDCGGFSPDRQRRLGQYAAPGFTITWRPAAGWATFAFFPGHPTWVLAWRRGRS